MWFKSDAHFLHRIQATHKVNGGTTAINLQPFVPTYRKGKKSIGLINERVISSAENDSAGVVKERSEFIEENYTEAICKSKFVNSLSSNF